MSALYAGAVCHHKLTRILAINDVEGPFECGLPFALHEQAEVDHTYLGMRPDAYYDDPATGRRRVVTISVEISEEMRDTLRVLAEDYGRPFGKAVRKLLEDLDLVGLADP